MYGAPPSVGACSDPRGDQMQHLNDIWKLHGHGGQVEPGEVVAPYERLAWPHTIGLGAQHVLAMFGSTVLVPVLTGFPPSTTLLFSGIGTLLFVIVTGNRMAESLPPSAASCAPGSPFSWSASSSTAPDIGSSRGCCHRWSPEPSWP